MCVFLSRDNNCFKIIGKRKNQTSIMTDAPGTAARAFNPGHAQGECAHKRLVEGVACKEDAHEEEARGNPEFPTFDSDFDAFARRGPPPSQACVNSVDSSSFNLQCLGLDYNGADEIASGLQKNKVFDGKTAFEWYGILLKKVEDTVWHGHEKVEVELAEITGLSAKDYKKLGTLLLEHPCEKRFEELERFFPAFTGVAPEGCLYAGAFTTDYYSDLKADLK